MVSMVDGDDRRAYWNERYAAQGDVFGVTPNEFVEAELAAAPAGRVLDLGCGQGRNAVWLASLGHDVTGVDQSDVAIDQARATAAQAGVDVEFLVADLVEWEPETQAYDIVLLSYLQLDEARRVIAHRKAVAALAPGGTLFLVAHHPRNLTEGYGGPQSPEVLAAEEELASDFAALRIERNEQVDRFVTRDGETHRAIDVILVATRA